MADGQPRKVETLDELAAEVIDAQPVRVTIVRHAAEHPDTSRFSDDFRIECGDTVLFLPDRLRRCATDVLGDDQ